MNEPISACRFLKMKGSYMQGFYCIVNEPILALRFFKVEGFYMQGFTVPQTSSFVC